MFKFGFEGGWCWSNVKASPEQEPSCRWDTLEALMSQGYFSAPMLRHNMLQVIYLTITIIPKLFN